MRQHWTALEPFSSPMSGLRPESSWNANFSASWSTGDDTYTATVSGHVFSTLFTDRIYADYDSLPNAIVYRNIDGVGWNRGFGARCSAHRGERLVVCTLGATMLRSQLLEGSGLAMVHGSWRRS
jgi:outer membrane receptor for ferrienterochelin and colicins